MVEFGFFFTFYLSVSADNNRNLIICSAQCLTCEHSVSRAVLSLIIEQAFKQSNQHCDYNPGLRLIIHLKSTLNLIDTAAIPMLICGALPSNWISE